MWADLCRVNNVFVTQAFQMFLETVRGGHLSHTQWLELHFVSVFIVLVNSVDARGRKTMVLGVVGDSE